MPGMYIHSYYYYFAYLYVSHSDREEHFTFVLTDLDSKYKFGFCRYPPKGETCMCFLR